MHQTDPCSKVIDLVNNIRSRQYIDGSIIKPNRHDYKQINRLIAELHRGATSFDGLNQSLLDATLEDLHQWVKNGLHHRPFFDRTLANFKTPIPGDAVFLLAPMRATNGPEPEGFRLEVVSGYHSETPYLIDAGQYTNRYVAPFQCIKLGIASKGFKQGNCIVLFPESVSVSRKVDKQGFALFFFNKFFHIFNRQTIVTADRLFGCNSKYLFGQLNSRGMSSAEMYDARCLWGYYHDYAHHSGPRPLDQNLHIKLNWFTGLLEELKCDLITVLLVLKHRMKFWQEITEFILLERMFRYPMGANQRMTFDAGSGILLFEILMKSSVLTINSHGYLQFDNERLSENLTKLILDIEWLETLDDESYLERSRDFIQQHLGTAQSAQVRFNLSTTQYARYVLKDSFK